MMTPETVATKFEESVGHLTDVAHKLTASIQSGHKEKARALFEDLLNSQPKVDIKITVPLNDNLQRIQENDFSVRVHVEDREAAGGMFIMKVRSCDTVLDLKRKFLLQYNLPIEVQRWIIGKRIRDDASSLYSCGVKGPGATLFLYIVTAHSVGLSRDTFDANRQAYAEGRFPMLINPQLSTSSDSSLLASTFTTYTGKPSSPGINSPFLDSQSAPDNNEKTNPFMTSSWSNQESNDGGLVFPESSKPASVTSGITPTTTSSSLTTQSADSGIVGGTTPENNSPSPSVSLIPSSVPQSLPLPEEPETLGWNCPSCTYRNLPTRPGCAMCSTSRPDSYEIPPDYQMTPEEMIRIAVDEEMERKTREPGSMGLAFDQDQDNMFLQMAQEDTYPQQFQFVEVDEEGFQILPQSILHEQSCHDNLSKTGSLGPRGPTQMQGSPLELLNEGNLPLSDEEDEDDRGNSSNT